MTASDDRIIAVPAARERPSRLTDAVDFILRSYDVAVKTEDVETGRALGRTLARDIVAAVDLPRFDSSAVDGFAVRGADLSAGAARTLAIVGRSAAGHPSDRPVGPGEAVRIFTGAEIPAGADRVLMQEICRYDGGSVTVPPQDATASSASGNIRRAGEDVARGSVAIAAGTRLTAGHLALGAALGHGTLPVRARLRVALFSTGDEVSAPSSELAKGRIVDANRPLLGGLLSGLGCEVDDRGILKDSADAQVAALMQAAQESDLIVTSGGMSVGEEDHLPQVIRRRGYLEVWRLRIKPGRPVGLGDIDDCPILALPGNPVAAAVTFLLLGTPLIGRLGGLQEVRPATLTLPLNGRIAKRTGRWEGVLARLHQAPGAVTAAEPLRKTGSAMLSSLAGADGIICLPEAVETVESGEPVEVVLLPR